MKNYLTALFVLLYSIAFSQTQLTKIISSSKSSNSSPQKPTTYNGKLYFVATEARTGNELWKTDGTDAGTSLVKDINAGTGNSVISNLVVFKNRLYFVADDGVHGPQFWMSDGTAEGTTIVTNNLPSSIYTIVVAGDYIYFLQAIDSRLGVWKFNGSNNGLTLVKGGISTMNAPDNLMSALGLVFFSAQTGNGGYSKVWRTDGTADGTYPITDELDGNGANLGGTAHPTQFIEYHGSLYFIARSYSKFGSNSVGIVKTNGTVIGTEYMLGIYNGSSEIVEFGHAVIHADKLYFSFFDFDHNHYSVWESDGTKSNTRNIYDLSNADYFSPSSLCSYRDGLFFTSGNANGGTSLVKYDAMAKEFYEVTELATQVSRPPFFIPGGYSASHTLGGNLLYIELIKTDINFGEIWVSDGSSSGTIKLSASVNSVSKDMILHNDMLFYVGVNSVKEIELWKTNGTLAGTSMVKDVNPSLRGVVLSSGIVKVKDVALFGGSTEGLGIELWVSDGTMTGTRMLVDIVPGASGSFPDNFINANDKVYFIASIGGRRSEVFVSDGTTAGTKQLTNLSIVNAYVYRLIKINEEKLIFEATNEDYTTSLFVMNLHTGSITEIRNLGKNSYNSPYSITDMAATSDGVLYFLLSGEGTDLWKTDGTDEGTVKIIDLVDAFQLTAVANEVYFIRKNTYGISKGDLYISDGTLPGTQLLKTDVSQNSQASSMVAYNGKLVFTSVDTSTGREVWITDGTSDNTVLLKDIASGSLNGVAEPDFRVNNGLLYFTAFNEVSGSELWQTDGTTSGTKMVKDIAPGNLSSKPYGLMSQNNSLYFSAYTETNGYEIWRTDGTETVLAVDVIPGAISSNPHEFLAVNDNVVLFMAESLTDGQQLYAFNELVTDTEQGGQHHIKVYPNPSSDVINISTTGLDGTVLSIYNASGTLMSSHTNIGSTSTINLQMYPSGLYLLRFTKDDKRYTFKVIKE